MYHKIMKYKKPSKKELESRERIARIADVVKYLARANTPDSEMFYTARYLKVRITKNLDLLLSNIWNRLLDLNRKNKFRPTKHLYNKFAGKL
jgi:hypothetical protein